MRVPLIHVGIYLVAWSFWFAVNWSIESYQRDLGAALTARGVVTTARVTESRPQDHNTICFVFDAGGTSTRVAT